MMGEFERKEHLVSTMMGRTINSESHDTYAFMIETNGVHRSKLFFVFHKRLFLERMMLIRRCTPYGKHSFAARVEQYDLPPTTNFN